MTWFYKCIIVLMMVLSMFVPNARADTCANNIATTFEWPLDDWETNCNDYWSTCNGNHHLGSDSAPGDDAVGLPVYAPCTGVVKESQFHNGYGGTVILECYTGDECVSVLMGHMFPESYTYNGTTYGGLQVSAGSNVSKGDLIGYIADQNLHRNGDYSPHSHIGIHKGSYSSTSVLSCDGGWSYAGYTSSNCVEDDWYSPDTFIADHQSTSTTSTYTIRMLRIANGSVGSYYHQMVNGQPTLQNYGTVISTIDTTHTLLTWQASDVYADSADTTDLIQVTTDSNHTYAWVYRATGDGGFYDLASWRQTSTPASAAFVADFSGDGLGDLILGYAQSTNKLMWKVCASNGVNSFNSCTDWTTSDQTDDDTFGQVGDTFVVGQFSGDLQLFRGREDSSCSGKLKWKRLNTTGSDSQLNVNSTGTACWGYPGYQYLAADVDGDSSDELVQVDTSDSSVEVKVGNYIDSTLGLTTTTWADDVGNTDGWYYLADMDYDSSFYPDLIRWSSSGTIAWLENQSGSSISGTASTLVDGIGRSDDYVLLFGDFGSHSITTITSLDTGNEDNDSDSYTPNDGDCNDTADHR